VKTNRWLFGLGSCAVVAVLSIALAPARPGEGAGATVGFLMSDYTTSARWQFDRDYFIAALKKLDPDVNVVVEDAKTDQTRQQTQAASLLTAGAKVLVDVAVDSQQAKKIVDLAHDASPPVPVIAYDRMIKGAKVDAYTSFDAVEIGRQQARFIVQHLKKGTIVAIEGAETDNNALILHQGSFEVLDPLIKSGRFTLGYDRYTPNWDANKAQAEMAAALNKLGDNVDAVLVANDGMASGVIAALKAQNLAGKVLVTGQDATVGGLQNVLLGYQSMTIYKPLPKLAAAAARVAHAFLHGKPMPATTHVDNGTTQVPAILLGTETVTKSNLKSTVLADKFATRAQLCDGLPAAACKGL
jgi:D-xylose transport system substrate-binding protein